MPRIWTAFWMILLPCLCSGEEVFLTPSRIFYDRNGLVLHETLSEQHTYYEPVPLDQVSVWLIGAVVATEDKRFYAHGGVDMAAVLRAAWQNVQQGEVVSGASTITQQLARAVTPRPKTFLGKTQEALSAIALEHRYTKEEILEQYFNRLEFGNLTQGVQAASRFYFNTDAAELSLSQAAFLVGLLKSPTYYNPLKHFKRALKRRDYVLEQMRERELIDEEMYRYAREEQLVLRARPRPAYAPHFTRFLAPLVPPASTQVYTTLDRDLQVQAERIVRNHLTRLSDSNVTQAAVVVLDNSTGGILAYVGSADFSDTKHSGQVDGVRALRQPGSALKPFVYGLAFFRGALSPAALLEDTDTFFEGGFRPRNYDESFHGKVSVRSALACSYNIPAVKAAEMTGTAVLLDLLHQLGFVSLAKPADFYGLGLALGNGEVRLLELVNAYAVLARGGMFEPVRLAHTPQIRLPGKAVRVLDEKTSYLITDILKDNQARAAAFGVNSPLVMPFELAAKTGTSKDYKDNFALGYTPRWTIGVWAGNFDASPMQKVSGITGAGPILHDIALEVYKRYPSPEFTIPAGIKRAAVCRETGLLAGPACAHTQEEVFDEKNLPAVCDGNHQSDKKTVQIVSPTAGDIFYIDPAMSRTAQQVKLAATCEQPVCHWQIDGKSLSDTACQTWWPLAGGEHTVSVVCNEQRDMVHFEVVQ